MPLMLSAQPFATHNGRAASKAQRVSDRQVRRNLHQARVRDLIMKVS
jgi:hypothetical protein